ncbi:hypothetical protein GCM10023321_70330 [Pseudonocardia eucalypti]|uniref:Novel STAND NTPase 1 domain-containing protein n=2 Tax=Pseudonocardia eucalypti TaxID=648755 RepID=A0ABP9R4X5_9PSEU
MRGAPDRDGHEVIARAVVRVCGESGEVAGAGFVVGANLVATCAHVVGVAHGVEWDGDSGCPPSGALWVEFPLLPGAVRCGATVARWSPMRADGTGDVAILALAERAPVGVPPMWEPGEVWGREFRVLGFPADLLDGEWVSGRFAGRQGSGWLQLRAADGGPRISGGFSGSPVWDVTAGCVVGMAVAARPEGPATAFALPVRDVLGLDPALLPNPYRGLEPFDEEHARFFCGRERDVERVLDALAGSPLVAVTGGSGVGKSSLLRAGVAPRLRAGGWRLGEIRTVGTVGGLRALAAALAPVLRPGLDADVAGGCVVALAERIRADLGSVAAELSERLGERELVLVADQFEELAVDRPAEARELLGALFELAEAVSVGDRLPFRVVLTLRGGSVDDLPPGRMAAALDAGRVVLRAMDRSQLRAAIVGPTEHSPGLSFEPGLVDRILDDTGVEPGRLPLLESLLTQLWEQRDGGLLRTARYRELGGVASAIARRAEEVFVELTASARDERGWRLLIRLARPAGPGFVRASCPLGELPAELAGVARRLAVERLVVLTHDAAGTATVELAHQALIDHWPAFRERLRADRRFLRWRQEMDRQYRHWVLSGGDPGALLRGGALGTAKEMRAERGVDLSAAHRDYIGASVARTRREVRRWRVAAAVFLVLALGAGTLAALVARSRADIRDARDAANVRAMAIDSANQARIEPDKAAQLALAAYRADPHSPEARSALGRAYLANLAVGQVVTGVTDTRIDQLLTSTDSDTVLVGHSGGHVVVSGLNEPVPRSWVLPDAADDMQLALTPDGRRVLGLDADNRLLTWDVPTQAGPVELAAPGGHREASANLAVSADGRRAVWTVQASSDRTDVWIWDLEANRPVEHHVRPPPTARVTEAWLTDDPGRVALRLGEPAAPDSRLVIYDLASGAQLRILSPGSALARHGILAIACQPTVSVSRASDGAPATAFPGLAGKGCADSDAGWVSLSGDREYLRYWTAEAGSDQQSLLTIFSLRDGRQYQLFLPGFWSFPIQPGPFRPLDTLGMLRGRGGAPSPVVALGESLYRFDPPAGQVPGPGSAPDPAGDTQLSLTGGVLRGLRGSGVPLGPPITLATDPAEIAWLHDPVYGRPHVLLRPEHDHQAFVLARDGTLGIWDLRTGRLLSRLATRVTSGGYTPPHSLLRYVVNRDGRYLAFMATDGVVQVWDIDAGAQVWTLPIPPMQLFGFDRTDELVVSDARGVSLWNFRDGSQVGPLAPAGGTTIPQPLLDRQTLTLRLSNTPITLDPEQWFARVCVAMNRPFTPAERARLPEGMPDEPPCARH